MSYAIRFRPIDPEDPSPALYLSRGDAPGARLTSVSRDVWASSSREGADDIIEEDWSLDVPRIRQRLVADVVPLADALADLATGAEKRPAAAGSMTAHQMATAALPMSARGRLVAWDVWWKRQKRLITAHATGASR